MDWTTPVGVGASTVVVLGGVVGVLRWIIRHEIRVVKDELKPNGGGSFRDHVDVRLTRQDDKLVELGERVAAIEGALGTRG